MKNSNKTVFKETVNQSISNRTLRGIAAKKLDKYLYTSMMNIGRAKLEQEKRDAYHFMSSIVKQAKKNLDKDFIKPNVVKTKKPMLFCLIRNIKNCWQNTIKNCSFLPSVSFMKSM